VKGRFIKKNDEAILLEVSGLGEAAGGDVGGKEELKPLPVGQMQRNATLDPDDILAIESLFPDPLDEMALMPATPQTTINGGRPSDPPMMTYPPTMGSPSGITGTTTSNRQQRFEAPWV